MQNVNERITENTDVDLGLDGDEEADQYLTFIMSDEEYGVDILSVQEIRGWETVTPIPNAPDHVKGVINLRGTIVPIIDLRRRFGLSKVAYGPLTVVIVLKVSTQKGDRVMGIVVDAVSDVYSISQKEMKSAPDLGDNINTAYIRGLVNVDTKMVILLNIDELLGTGSIPEVSADAIRELKDSSL